MRAFTEILPSKERWRFVLKFEVINDEMLRDLVSGKLSGYSFSSHPWCAVGDLITWHRDGCIVASATILGVEKTEDKALSYMLKFAGVQCYSDERKQK